MHAWCIYIATSIPEWNKLRCLNYIYNFIYIASPWRPLMHVQCTIKYIIPMNSCIYTIFFNTDGYNHAVFILSHASCTEIPHKQYFNTMATYAWHIYNIQYVCMCVIHTLYITKPHGPMDQSINHAPKLYIVL